MFRVATSVKFLNDVLLECTFNDGMIYQYDISKLFKRFPQFEELRKNRVLFLSGKVGLNGYCIYWNDDLDIDSAEIYENGTLVDQFEIPLNKKIGIALFNARIEAWMSQKQLAEKSGINQADISRIEKGSGNPTLKKIVTLFNALGKSLEINVK